MSRCQRSHRLAAASASARRLSRHRRPPAHVARDAGRRACPSRNGSSHVATGRGHGVRFEGAEARGPAPGVLEALAGADMILLAPSNPYVSIAPILAVAEIRAALGRAASQPSPSVPSSGGGGEGARRPDARVGWRAGRRRACRRVYEGLIDTLVVDEADADTATGRRCLSGHADAHGGAAPAAAWPRRHWVRCRSREGRNRRRDGRVRTGAGEAAARRGGRGRDRIARRRARRRRPRGSSASRADRTGGRRGVDLVVLAVAAGAAVQTAKSLARAIGSTPLLSVASELRFGDGTGSGREAKGPPSPSRWPQTSPARSRPGSTPSPPERSPATALPTRTPSSAATTRGEGAFARARVGRLVAAARWTPGRSRMPGRSRGSRPSSSA